MPRLLDPLERRAQICAAVWKLLATGGMSGVSYRAVAAESGLAVASVRHFAGSRELLLFRAMAALLREQRRGGSGDFDARRLRALSREDPVGFGCWVLSLFVPRTEQHVTRERAWAIFALEAGPFADVLRHERDTDLRMACSSVVGRLARSGRVHPSHDQQHETDRLWRLVEGMIWRAATSTGVLEDDPSLLRLHLEGLADPTSGRGSGSDPGPSEGCNARPR